MKQYKRIDIEVKESDWCEVISSSSGKVKLTIANISDPNSKVDSVSVCLPFTLSQTIAELLIEMLSQKAFLCNDADKACLAALRTYINAPDSKPDVVVEAEENKLLSMYGYDPDSF